MREFTPVLPLPPQRDVWHQACVAAREFWARAADDARVSAEFRQLCGRHGQQLDAASRHA